MRDERVPTVPSEPCWVESIQAIKDCTGFQSYDEFRAHLIRTLPQNSLATRERYAGYILRRFFSDGSLDQLPVAVWHAYEDDELLEQVTRYPFLSSEPLVGAFVADVIFRLGPGTEIPRMLIQDYVFSVYGEAKEKVVARLAGSVRALGFIARVDNTWTVQGVSNPELALLILTHYLFAPVPAVVTLERILSDPYWKYLGLMDELSVRHTLRAAASQGLVAKYVVADEVEQITTRYSLDEFLERRIRV